MEAPYSRTLSDLLAEIAARHPDHAALIWQDQEVTFAEWRERSAAIAGAFTALGVGRGDTVGILSSNRPEWLYTFFGAAAIGATVATFNTWAKTWDLEYMLRHSGLNVLVTLGRFRSQDYLASLRELLPELWEAPAGSWRSARFPHLRHVVVIGEEVPLGAVAFDEWAVGGARAPVHRLPPGVGPTAGDAAVVVYTSGSTARPKAVPLLHYGIVENGYNIGERQGIGFGDRVWISVPLFWSYGCANALPAALSHGATIVLQEAFEAKEALELIERHQCTVAYLLPNMVRGLLEAPDFRPDRTRSLRTGLMLGLPKDIQKTAVDLGVTGICNIYGFTEGYGNCFVTPTNYPLEVRMRCQGPLLPGFTVRIADPETGGSLPPGQVGDLLVKGYITPGYQNDPEANAAAFTPEGFFRTGDIGHLDEEGRFHFFARDNEMIKTGGINVSPLEVEEFLSSHPAVAQAAVTGVPDPTLGEVVVAFVVPAAEAEVSPEALRIYCKQHIAGFKVPTCIITCAELPKTDTGKISRRERKAWGQAALQQGG